MIAQALGNFGSGLWQRITAGFAFRPAGEQFLCVVFVHLTHVENGLIWNTLAAQRFPVIADYQQEPVDRNLQRGSSMSSFAGGLSITTRHRAPA